MNSKIHTAQTGGTVMNQGMPSVYAPPFIMPVAHEFKGGCGSPAVYVCPTAVQSTPAFILS